MSDGSPQLWQAANQRYLLAALDAVRECLERHVGRRGQGAPEAPEPPFPSPELRKHLDEAERSLPGPAAVDVLADAFGLSPFERDVVLLCAGVELDSAFHAACAEASGDPARPYPTFSLALAALPEPHWSALSAEAPLRRARLVSLDPGASLTLSRLRIDERVLHYLVGVGGLDERLAGVVDPSPAPGDELSPSQRQAAERLAAAWARAPGRGRRPVLMVCGPDEVTRARVAAAGCAALGLRLMSARASDLPANASDRESFCRLWEREAILSGAALVVEFDESDPAEVSRAGASAVERTSGLLLVSTRDPVRLRRRSVVRVDVPRAPPAEQEALWRRALGPLGEKLNGQVEEVVAQFSLGLPAMEAVAAELLGSAGGGAQPEPGALWAACRGQARPRLEDLAQRIEAVASWEELVLPPEQLELLRALSAQVRQRARVYEQWGFSQRGSRGLGISALFSGVSGTGKTMAAEVLARDLQLDLYRIDLSQVVSKYIGETEKNLRRIFDAAEEGGALLLFDEADALFGKRSEVKDSHDRYANLEVSYLLQRMEAYRGLAILTTNLRSALDTAFLRRLRFIVEFPFPDQQQRAEIWRRVFPPSTPTENLEPEKLARLSVAGGVIRSIALNAAFLAADQRTPVRMGHLAQAARAELTKLEKPQADAELGGWT